MKRINLNLEIKGEELTHKHCIRFKPKIKSEVTHANAVLYSKLIDEGCEKRAAMIYATKTFCRFDTTKIKDGPSTCRKLKIEMDSVLAQTNGWTFLQPKYDLGKNYRRSIDEIIIKDPQTETFDFYLTRHDKILKSEHREKLKHTQEFIQDINQTCKFTNLSNQELKKKLSALRNREKTKDLKIEVEPQISRNNSRQSNNEISDQFLSIYGDKIISKSARSSSSPAFDRLTPSTQRASIVPDSLSRLEDIDAKYDEVKQKIDIFKHFIDENKNIKLKINQKTKRMVPIEEDPVQLKYKDPVLAEEFNKVTYLYAGKPLEPESPKERKEHAKKIILKMKNTNALEKQAFDEVLETLRESPKHSHKKTETSSLNDLTNSIKKIEEEWEKKTKKPKIKIMIKKNAKHKSDDMTPISGSMTPLSSTRKKFLIGTPIFTPRSSMSKVMFKSSSCTSLDKIISITPRNKNNSVKFSGIKE